MLHLRYNIYTNPFFWVVTAMVSIALLLGLGLAYFSSNLSTLFQSQEDYRSYLSTTNNLKYNLLNAETGQRGFLITQDDRYLKPYTTALPLIQKDLQYLQKTPLSEPYKDKIDEIAQISNRKVAELALTIKTARDESNEEAISIVNTDSGLDDMDKLRGLLSTVTNDQNAQLQLKIKSAQSQINILQYLAPVVAFLDIMLIIIILLLTKRAVKREQQLDDLKEQFVALASHQLRTPATAVKQYLYLLINGTFGQIKKEQREVLEKINESNERGIKIANNLLNVTIADSGRVKISETPVDIGQLLMHVLTHYTDALKESRNQKIIVKIPKKSVHAKVDPFQIRLIYENLIENASKYSGDGTKIHVTLAESEDWVTFSVKDQGIGISKENIPMLFKKFARLDQAARKAEGSGLGLFLVKQAAELHGGDVHIDSIVGKGSTFTARIKKSR